MIYHSFAFLFIYFPSKLIIKKISQASVFNDKNDEDLIVLAFNIENLNSNKYHFTWEEEDEEFRYENHLYDVKNKLVLGDSVYFTCYFDEDENLIDNFFNEITEHNKKEKSRTEFFSISVVGLFYEEISPLKFYSDKNSTLCYLTVEKNNFNFISEIPSPPPRLQV